VAAPFVTLINMSRGRVVRVIVVGGLFIVLAGCGAQPDDSAHVKTSTAASSSSTPNTPTPDPQHAPAVLDVTCFDDRTTLSSSLLVTSFDGIHLRVHDQTSTPGTEGLSVHAFIDDPTSGEGSVVTGAVASIVLSLPPGRIHVVCQHSRKGDEPVPVTVVDPAGNYRPQPSLAALGCHPTGSYYPTIHDGKTPEAAVQAAIGWEDQSHTYQVHRFDGAYWQTPGYSFVLDRDGQPWASGIVTQIDGHYRAMLNGDC
jgi:hypothetical protein